MLAEAAVERLFGETGEIVARFDGSDLVGSRYLRPFTDLPLDATGERVRRRRLRVDDRRFGHGPHGAHVRRGRLERRARRGPAGPESRRRRRQVRRDRAPTHRHVREGRRPHADRRPRRAWAPRARGAVRALLPTLLALRHAPHLLGQDVVVRAHLRAAWRDGPRERAHRLASRAHQARALRQLARDERRLGAVARPVLGHAVAGVALLGPPRHLHRQRRRAVAARGPRPDRARPASPVCRRGDLPVSGRRLRAGRAPAAARDRHVV